MLGLLPKRSAMRCSPLRPTRSIFPGEVPIAMNDILCTSDLTPTSVTALRFALREADHFSSSVTLLHVISKGGEAERSDATKKLAQQIKGADGTERVNVRLVEGKFMERIAEESTQGHGLTVVGTHGPKGLRQNLFGADILKLVRSLNTPSLVVQEGSDPNVNMDRIVLPVAGHSDIEKLLGMVCDLAKRHASEVHVYQLMRPNESPSDELLANKLHMLNRLQEEGLRYVEANEPSTTFSVGFAGPTVEYASRIGAGCIAIKAHASDEYRYIADAEKERILVNEALIPVLCA